MKIIIDDRPVRSRCRYCKTPAKWDFMRVISSWTTHHNSVCDKHLGTALRNAGLVKLTIEQHAEVTAEIRP